MHINELILTTLKTEDETFVFLFYNNNMSFTMTTAKTITASVEDLQVESNVFGYYQYICLTYFYV